MSDTDIKYLELIRELHKAERRIQDLIPIDMLDVTFENLGKIASEKPYEPKFEDGLPNELVRIEFRRLKALRIKAYQDIRNFYNDDKKFTDFYNEYHDLKESDKIIKGVDIPMFVPKNDIGVITISGEDSVLIPKDKLPVTYQVLDKFPINDGNVKDEAIRVKVNSVELTIKYDMYVFLDWIKENYIDERFHFATLLRDLEIEGKIKTDYRGKPNDFFQTRKELLPMLFKKEKQPKGYWRCRIKHWID
jgi:hypothetical protein